MRLSLLAPLMRCCARSLTLRLFLTFLLLDLVELASLVADTWRRNVRENQLRLCWRGCWPGYSGVRNGLWNGGEVKN